MFLAPLVMDGFAERKLQLGDLLCQFDPLPPATDTTNTTLAVTAASMVNNPVYVRNPAGVSTDTYPTADALISLLLQGLGLNRGLPPGLTFRWRVINLSANLITGAVTAHTGATMVRGNIPASTTKDFQIAITNGTPLRTVVNIASTSGSAILTGFANADIKALSIGMVVTNAVVNVQDQTIIGINAQNNSVTLSGNANATGFNSFTFSPTYTITGLAA